MAGSRFNRASRALTYLGIVGIVTGLSAVHGLGHGYDFFDSPSRMAVSALYILILVIAAYGAGFPEIPATTRSAFSSAVAATGAGALVMSAIQLLTGDALLPRLVVFGSAVSLTSWLTACASLSWGARHRARERAKLVLVAERDEYKALKDELALSPHRPGQLVRALLVEEASSSHPDKTPLADAVAETGASIVVLSRDAQLDESIISQVAELHARGTRVRTLSQFYEEWMGKLPLSELERKSLLFDIREVHYDRYRPVKRLLDVAAGSVGLVVLVVITPLVLMGNILGNRGRLLYRQARVGKDGQQFEIMKFRTMRPSDVTNMTTEDDPRVTPFGRFMRKTHIDELPQSINLLRGDLSIVGPRPEQPQYVEQFSQTIPFYRLRHLVRPGLTGWAQVNYGYAEDESGALEKLQYEFFYLQHQSLSLDLQIIGRTIRSVLKQLGR